MTTEHSITPPPELLQQWATEYWGNPGESIGEGEKYIATQAARWGADQELDACCVVVDDATVVPLNAGQWLRATRRPKPPSLAEGALTSLSHLKTDLRQFGLGSGSNDIHTIRAALERLKELEKDNE